uniref:RNA polymerase sigma-70 factor n=1 Tax=uncultured Draconibacterium sp. TaxID=1573823 RepID=UPI0032165AB3
MQETKENIRLLKKGNKSAFEKIYEEYYEMLLYISLQYLSSREDAKEAVQDAFVKLWANKESVKENASLRNFLYTITKNNCLNILKKQEVILRSQEDLKWMEIHYHHEAMNRLGFDFLEFKELKQKIEDAIERLPDHCREVFRLSRFSQLKNKEIAERLEISEKTVESHITKALRLLRKDLKPYLSILLIISDLFS